MSTYQEVVKELDSKIPRDVIEQRDAGNGRKLSYLPGHYVIDRLNKVIGIGKWAYGSEITKLYDGPDAKNRPYVSYTARVKLVVELGDGIKTEFVDYGFGDGMDPYNPGKAHELAIKESVTDGLKRVAKNLGMSMGLALYDKEQENVEDQKPAPRSVGAARATPTTGAILDQLVAEKIASVDKQVEAAGPEQGIDKAINAFGKVAVMKKLMSTDDVKGLIKEYGADKAADLTPENAQKVYAILKERVNNGK